MERGCSTVVCLFIFTTIHLWAFHAADDAAVLIAFKNAVSDPNHELQSWHPNSSPCNWDHIDCDDSDTYVTDLNLANLNLAGPLVPILADLTSLVHLELFKNQINGSIPNELGNLANLESLDLYDNSLSGSIPEELGNLTKLEFLRLNDNSLTGKVPEELKNLPNLKLVNLTNNLGLCGYKADNPTCL